MPNEISGITGDILLDAGTNELEVLVFSLAGGWFGVNVAKVREVIRPVPLVASPHRHASVMGMFNIRGSVLPVVDLARHMGMTRSRYSAQLKADEPEPEGRVIITEFNGFRCGFRVDTVEQIYRVSWSSIKPAPETDVDRRGPVDVVSSTTGVLEMNGRLILMVDFESVADSILHEKRLHVGAVENKVGVDRGSHRVVLVEDSPFMRRLIRDTFVASGYTQTVIYSDGQSAWDALSAEGATPPDAVISDIEMPRMDGLRLCKLIKEFPALRGVPVVLFSSLVSEDNVKKGRQVGADLQVPKPELAEMVRIVDRAIAGELIGASSEPATASA
ncbi:MAG: chemotaxis protein CheV [Phycisphaerales bacterium]